MYAITIVTFGWISHDFSNLENASLRLKEDLVHIVGPTNKQTFHDEELPTLQILSDEVRLNSTLILKTSLPILGYCSYPLKLPLQNISTNLGKIERHVRAQETKTTF